MRAIALALLVATVIAACSTDQAEPPRTSVPTSSLATVVFETPPPQITPIVSGGWAVALLEDRMVAVPLPHYERDLADATTLTSSPFGESAFATYAGSAHGWVYVVEHAGTAVRNHAARLVRTRLGDGEQEALLEFRTNTTLINDLLRAPVASVSPGGAIVAVADDLGLLLLNTSTGEQTRIIDAPCPEDLGDKGCPILLDPEWSPDGTRLLVRKLLYEGSHAVLVDVPTGAVTELTKVPADVTSWAPDSRTFCALNEIYVPAGVLIVSAEGEILAHLAPTVDGVPSACGFSPDGRLAIASVRDAIPGPSGETYPETVLSVREGNALETPVSEYPLPGYGVRMAGWTPGGEGVMVWRPAACEPTPCPDFYVSGVHDPGVSYQGFSFQSVAVLAVIPAP